MQITKEDFDNAVRQPWDAGTCIASQASLRLGVSMSSRNSKHESAATELFRSLPYSKEQKLRLNIVRVFDSNFHHPGDENKPELQALRASLPITI